jgi:parallel beta-helix repeat protein
MRIRFYFLALLSVVALTTPALAMTWNVPGDFPTIQQAINASVSGDIVLVAPGIYPENITVGPAQNGIKIHSSGGAAVTTIDGGAANTVASFSSVGITTELVGFTLTNGNGANGGGLSLVNANPRIDSNIINGNVANLGGGIYAFHSSSTVVNNTITSNQALGAGAAGGGLFLDNASLLQMTNNNTVDGNSTTGSGGGFFIQASSNATISNNTITNNSAGTNGGAFFITGSTTAPTIKNNQIRSNHADTGIGGGFEIVSGAFPAISQNQIVSNTGLTTGGIHLVGSSGSISGNNIQDNATPTGSGGGISCNANSNPSITTNLIIRNFAGTNGGGVFASGSVVRLTSNTIALNSGVVDGGGVYSSNGSRVILSRDIVSNSPVGNGISVDGNSSAVVSCCDVWSNNAVNYNGMPDQTGVLNNISMDPEYCDIFSLDFHLFMSSPCTAANDPACGLVGALDVGCDGPVKVEGKSWGSIKARYR